MDKTNQTHEKVITALSYLNDQYRQEIFCAALLRISGGYTDIEPILPSGGPDGGIDVRARYNNEPVWVTIKFNKNPRERKLARKSVTKEIKNDIQKAAKKADEDKKTILHTLTVFTNVELSPSFKDEIKKHATSNGFNHVDIFDANRMVSLLASPQGYGIRLEFLGIEMTQSELVSYNNIQSKKMDNQLNELRREISALQMATKFILDNQTGGSERVGVRLNASGLMVIGSDTLPQHNVQLRVYHIQSQQDIVFDLGLVAPSTATIICKKLPFTPPHSDAKFLNVFVSALNASYSYSIYAHFDGSHTYSYSTSDPIEHLDRTVGLSS